MNWSPHISKTALAGSTANNRTMSESPAIIPSQTSQTIAPPADKAASNGDHKPLPKLPIPKLEDTCKRYLRALEGLQDADEHQRTKAVVEDFLTSGEGEKWQQKLLEYDSSVDSYIEEFWCKLGGRRYGWKLIADESYLSHSDSVVLSLNPFFVLS